MKTSLSLLTLLSFLVWMAPNAAAQSRQSQINQLAETGSLYGGELASNDSNRAAEHMVDMAGELQALYDFGGTTVPDAAIREEIEERSEALSESASSLIGFINKVSRPPDEPEPITLPDENYDARSLRLVTTYLDLVDSLTLFANGEPIEGEEADRLRSGLETIGAVAAALPETEF